MNYVPELGKLADDTARRDAIHVAVAPVVAGEELSPGQHVQLEDDKAVRDYGKTIGIVDPFLRVAVGKGERFWLFLYPNTVTSLRHVWSHPEFKEEESQVKKVFQSSEKQQAEDWLRSLASRAGETCVNYGEEDEETWENITYENLIEAGHAYLDSNGRNWFIQAGSSSLRDLMYDEKDAQSKFWECWELVTGRKVEGELRKETPFSCSC